MVMGYLLMSLAGSFFGPLRTGWIDRSYGLGAASILGAERDAGMGGDAHARGR